MYVVATHEEGKKRRQPLPSSSPRQKEITHFLLPFSISFLGLCMQGSRGRDPLSTPSSEQDPLQILVCTCVNLRHIANTSNIANPLAKIPMSGTAYYVSTDSYVIRLLKWGSISGGISPPKEQFAPPTYISLLFPSISGSIAISH